MKPAAQTQQHANRWRSKVISTSKSMTCRFFCKTWQARQPRSHFYTPVLSQSKDPAYYTAIYDTIMRPGKERTCGDKKPSRDEKQNICQICGSAGEFKAQQISNKTRNTNLGTFRCINCPKTLTCDICQEERLIDHFNDSQLKHKQRTQASGTVTCTRCETPDSPKTLQSDICEKEDP